MNKLLIVAILSIGFVACGSDNENPTCICPSQGEHFESCEYYECEAGGCEIDARNQSETITIAEGKIVTVNFMTKLGTTPTWWNTLVSALENRAGGFAIGNFSLTVIADGTGGFVAGVPGSKTATVSDTWLSQSDYNTMRIAINEILDDWGIAMEKSTIRAMICIFDTLTLN